MYTRIPLGIVTPTVKLGNANAQLCGNYSGPILNDKPLRYEESSLKAMWLHLIQGANSPPLERRLFMLHANNLGIYSHGFKRLDTTSALILRLGDYYILEVS